MHKKTSLKPSVLLRILTIILVSLMVNISTTYIRANHIEKNTIHLNKILKQHNQTEQIKNMDIF